MEIRPKVSIIIPVYGVEKYIERCARSLFEQTLDDIEFLFVDDCTPDGSISILKKVLNEYPFRINQVVIHRMEKNSGQTAVRQWGCEHVHGDYVIHCDSDDWIEENMLQTMYDTAVSGSFDIVFCDLFRSEGIGKSQHMVQQVPENKINLLHDLLSGKVHGSLCNKLISRKLYNKSLAFPKDNMNEDLVLSVQLCYYAKTYKHIPVPFYHYFINSNSITQDSSNLETYLNREYQSMRNFSIIEKFLNDKQLIQYFEVAFLQYKIGKKVIVNKLTLLPNGWKRWREIYPEISLMDVAVYGQGLKSKIIYLLTYFNIYKFLKNIQKKISR